MNRLYRSVFLLLQIPAFFCGVMGGYGMAKNYEVGQ
jgi:hypothetical protein